MVNCKHVLEKPKIEDIYEFCEYGEPDYVMVRMKCAHNASLSLVWPLLDQVMAMPWLMDGPTSANSEVNDLRRDSADLTSPNLIREYAALITDCNWVCF